MTNNWSTPNPSPALSDDARNTLKRLRRFFSLSAIFNNYGNRACSRGAFLYRGAMAPCLRKPPKLSEASPLAPVCFRR